MKTLPLAAAAALLATGAAAHEGAHLHPHGAEPALMLILAAAVIGVAAWALLGR